jgi:anti-sigma-K factor RskA
LDWAPYALAAAFALISLGLLVWNVALLSGNGDSDTRVVLLTGTGGSGAVVFDGDDATLELAGMDALDAASDYQAWLIEDGVPVPVGVLQVSAAGEATQSLGASLPANAVVAVTIEPAGGSAQPTSAPILSGEL